MREADILKTILQTEFGDRYDIRAFTNLLQSPEEEVRWQKTTEEVLVSMLDENRVRGVLRTSQADYLSVPGVSSSSFTWSLELATDVRDTAVDAEVGAVIAELSGRVLSATIGGTGFQVVMTFAMPAKFGMRTISGRDYVSVVLGGKCTVSDRSALADLVRFRLDGTPLAGVLSASFGVTAQGENATTESGGTLPETAVQAQNVALSVSIHLLRDDALHRKLFKSLLSPQAEPEPYDLKIYWDPDMQMSSQDEGEDRNGNPEQPEEETLVAAYPAAKLGQGSAVLNMGSYIVLELQFLRA